MFFEMATGAKPVMEDGYTIGASTWEPLINDNDTLEVCQFMLKYKSTDRPKVEECLALITDVMARRGHPGVTSTEPM